ncbi:unnamed protein product, partial [Iphiclides podalirius]
MKYGIGLNLYLSKNKSSIMTLFGEIVEPSSRTIWEDWDDTTPENDINLQWEYHVEINEEIHSFYLLDGKYFKNFIDITSQQLQLVNKIKKIDLSLYKIGAPPKYICTVKDYDMVLKFEYPKLEQPNILSGVSAGVIILREQLDLMGVAIICYVEYTDDYQVKEIQKILNKLGIGSISTSGFSEIINSNLYI